MIPFKYIVKTFIKNLCTQNFFVKKKTNAFHKYMKNRYKCEEPPTIISSNCIGGLIYHNLGLKFTSPTINLSFRNNTFLKFISNLEYYLSIELTEGRFVKSSAYPYGGYPIGKLEDIEVQFNHYKSFEEAKQKWDERKKRISMENLYIIMSTDSLTDEQIRALGEIKCKRIVVFSNREIVGAEHVFVLNSCVGKKGVGPFANIKVDGFRIYEKEFDYVAWLNGEDDYRIKYFDKKGSN